MKTQTILYVIAFFAVQVIWVAACNSQSKVKNSSLNNFLHTQSEYNVAVANETVDALTKDEEMFSVVPINFLVDEANSFSKEVAPVEPAELQIFRDGYSGISFDANYDKEKDDWLVDMTFGEATTQFYWAGGRFVPPEKYEEREKFWSLLYNYAKEIPDPANFTEEEVERIRKFSSPENRRNSGGSPQFFYDAVYDCTTQRSVERHIVRHRFLGYGVNAHERLREPFARVEQRILEMAKTDEEVKKFLDTLANVDGYNWRPIRDSGKRSFHSIGIAIDVLPERWGHKNIYWAWRRDIDPDNWMLLPLDRRWMPPLAVIDIFEDEGFIWGGKWTIWDNMHFEYHPELVLYRKFREKQSK